MKKYGPQGEVPDMDVAEQATPLALSITDTSKFREGRITVCFRNEGKQSVRIPDEINDETAGYFFLMVLRTEGGDARILNAELGKITFQRLLNYRELAPQPGVQRYDSGVPG